MGSRSLAFTLLAIAEFSPAMASSYVYDAICTNSYSKQGEQQDDLTKQSGKPIKCDSAVLSLLDNGRVLLQVSEKKGKLTPLGFSGAGLDFDTNPNFITLPLQSIYLPHSTGTGNPEKIEGIEGFCFLDGKANLRALTSATCVAKIEIGTQRLVYHVEVHIKGIGQAVP